MAEPQGKLTPAQYEIMELVWTAGPAGATIGELWEAIAARRAVLRTTVQNLVDLDRWPANEEARFGQVKLTIAQFFRVSGGSTQNKGVEPDIDFPVSVDASEYGESTYDNALPWTRIAAVPHVRYGNFEPLLPKLESLHAERIVLAAGAFGSPVSIW